MKIFSLLETDRLVIRPIKQSDAEAYFAAEMASIRELAPHWSWVTTDKSIANINEFIQEAERFHAEENPTDMYFVILSREDKRFLGCIWCYPINWLVPHFEIHYWLDSREANQGYMTEALNALSQACFKIYKAKRIQIKISVENLKSQAVVQKLGYKLEGVMEQYFCNFVTHQTLNGLLFACCSIESLPPLHVTLNKN